MIDVATQWTDRHFIDPSLTIAAWAAGENMNKKRNVSVQWGGWAYFSYKTSKIFVILQYFRLELGSTHVLCRSFCVLMSSPTAHGHN